MQILRMLARSLHLALPAMCNARFHPTASSRMRICCCMSALMIRISARIRCLRSTIYWWVFRLCCAARLSISATFLLCRCSDHYGLARRIFASIDCSCHWNSARLVSARVVRCLSLAQFEWRLSMAQFSVVQLFGSTLRRVCSARLLFQSVLFLALWARFPVYLNLPFVVSALCRLVEFLLI